MKRVVVMSQDQAVKMNRDLKSGALLALRNKDIVDLGAAQQAADKEQTKNPTLSVFLINSGAGYLVAGKPRSAA